MKIIIVPDVHGRTFWRKCKDLINSIDKIIFLGDYLDPYVDIDPEEALEEFKQIIEFKKENPDKVILLIGNHDCGYFPELLSSYSCRRYEKAKYEISNLFMDNLNLFDLTYAYDKYLFSHAGIVPEWFDYIKSERFFNIYKIENKDEFLNLQLTDLSPLLTMNNGIKALWMISRDRGGRDSYGSCIWADIHEHIGYYWNKPLEGWYQIFAHSLYYPNLNDYFINENLAMLDCAKLFTLDENGIIEVC